MTETAAASPVKKIRDEMKMTQEQFSEFLGYVPVSSGVRAISRWESGREPRGASLRRLCARTGKSAGFFLGTEDAEEEATLVGALLEFLMQQKAAKSAQVVA